MIVIKIIREALFIAAAAILLAAFACIAFKIKPAVVVSGSMEPTFHTGSVAFVKQGAGYKIGDPVAFTVEGAYVTHRLEREEDGLYVTKGDANKSEDPWRVTPTDIEGKVIFNIPFIGFVFAFLKTQAGIVVIAAFLILTILSSFISTPERRKEATQ